MVFAIDRRQSYRVAAILRPRTLVAIGLAITVSACAVGPDFHPPVAPTTTRYASDQDPAVSATPQIVLGAKISRQWWTFFRSPSVDGVIRKALAHSPTLVAATATLAKAQEQVSVATGELEPQIDIGASAGRQKPGAAFVGPLARHFSPFTAYSIGSTVHYNLDLFGGTRRLIEQQTALARYQRYRLDAAYLSLTGSVVTESVGIAALRLRIAIVQSIIVDDQKNVDLVQAAYTVGAATVVDVTSVQSQLANDQTLLPPLRQQLSEGRDALAILVGDTPGDWQAPAFDLDKITLPDAMPVVLPSELVHQRPDILAAEAQLHAASAAIGVATANMFPKIELSASAATEELTTGALFGPGSAAWNLIASISQPIFHGGELAAKRRAAIDDFHAAMADYEQTVLQSLGQVADNLHALAHDGEELAAQKRAVKAADLSLQLTRAAFEAGQVGAIDVLDAERRAQQARLGYARARAQQYADATQLFLATGGGVVDGDWARGQWAPNG